MDPRDFNFALRSGNANQAPIDWDNAYSLMAMGAFFMEKATLAAGRYVELSGRQQITGKDMILCLKYTALPSTNFWQTENLVEHVREWKNRLLAEDSEEEEEELSDEEVEEEQSEEDFVYSSSSDEFTLAVNRAETEFEAWQPTDEIGQAVHRAIRRAEISLLAQEV